MTIEGALKRRHKLARKCRNRKLCPSADFVQLFYQYPQKYPFYFEFEILGAQPCQPGLFFTNEEQKENEKNTKKHTHTTDS